MSKNKSKDKVEKKMTEAQKPTTKGNAKIEMSETVIVNKQKLNNISVDKETTTEDSIKDTEKASIENRNNDNEVVKNQTANINKNEIETLEEKSETEKDIKDKKEHVLHHEHFKLNKKRIIICGIILFVLVAVIVSFCLTNKMKTNIYNNVYLGDKSISNMNAKQLNDYIEGVDNKIKTVSIKIGQKGKAILEVVPQDIDFEVNIEETSKQALKFGRDSNIIKNNAEIFFALLKGKKLNIIYKYDVNKLSNISKEVKESIDGKTIDDNYILDKDANKLIISIGKTGLSIDENVLKENIVSLLSKGKSTEYELKTKETKPLKLDVDVVYSQVYKEPKDAYIDKTGEKVKLVLHEVGYDFDKEDLRKVLATKENQKEGKVIEYSIKTTNPKIMTKDIAWNMYEYQITSYTTYFPVYDSNRVNNVRIALELLNNKIVMPGEVFSYNSIVGGATSAQGFLPAATFVGGRVVKEVGGGICQTVSTLYNVALLANMEIVQRKAHSLPVGYVPPSRDATVYYPSIDFKFKNNREYPIKIVTYFNANGSLTIYMYGTKEDNEYEISISSKVLGYTNYSTVYNEDASANKGTKTVIQSGSNGYTSQAYITKKLGGRVVETKTLSTDTYKAASQIVSIGTKETASVAPATPATPAAPETPSTPTEGNSGGEGNTQTP